MGWSSSSLTSADKSSSDGGVLNLYVDTAAWSSSISGTILLNVYLLTHYCWHIINTRNCSSVSMGIPTVAQPLEFPDQSDFDPAFTMDYDFGLRLRLNPLRPLSTDILDILTAL